MQEFPLSKRLPWALLVSLMQSVYFPTSQATSGGIAPKLPIDVFPVIPIWVVPIRHNLSLSVAHLPIFIHQSTRIFGKVLA
jgi:hypothetical protein